MFGLAAIVMFAIAVFMRLPGDSSRYADAGLFTIIGLLCLAIHLTAPWPGSWWHRNPPPG